MSTIKLQLPSVGTWLPARRAEMAPDAAALPEGKDPRQRTESSAVCSCAQIAVCSTDLLRLPWGELHDGRCSPGAHTASPRIPRASPSHPFRILASPSVLLIYHSCAVSNACTSVHANDANHPKPVCFLTLRDPRLGLSFLGRRQCAVLGGLPQC